MLELLAPAGNLKALQLAIYNGANAVYIGAKGFNARQKAEGIEDLKAAVDFCHLFGVKCYLALNIAIKDKEIEKASEVIKEALSACVDAFIISDLTIFNIIKSLSPKAMVHASTQMGIHNADGAKFLESLGFDRIILSRETTLQDIKEIKEQTNIEIECFVHGALCVAFSGACLMSSIRTGESGNRGRCLQPCRQEYTAEVKDKPIKSGYLLSPSDLCSINDLEELIEAGVTSFKIEGRLRRNEYVGLVVGEYRKALDKLEYNITNIKKLFNRGDFTRGYIYDSAKKLMSISTPSHIGIKIGKVIASKSLNQCIISSSHKINPNDGFKIIRNGKETGAFSGFSVKEIKAGEYIVGYKGEAKVNDDINITTDYMLQNQIAEKELKIDAEIDFCLNEKTTRAIIYSNKCSYEYTDFKFIKAEKKPTSKSEIEEQLKKSGQTFFNVKSVKVETDNAFIAKSELNFIRRTLLEKIKEKIILNYSVLESNNVSIIKFNINNSNKCDSYISVGLNNYSSVIENENFYKIVLSPTDYNSIENIKVRAEKKLYLELPVFATNQDITLYKRIISKKLFYGILANNYYALNLAKDNNLPCILGINFNITNSKNPLIDFCEDFIISPELALSETKNFARGIFYGFGNMPLMHIIHNVSDLLDTKAKELIYKDRKYRYNIKEIYGKTSQYTLYNPVITDIIDEIKGYGIFLDVEDSKQKLNNAIKRLQNKRKKESEHTSGHLKRGVV